MSYSEFKITDDNKIFLKDTGKELTLEDLLNARKVDIHNFLTEKGKKSIGFISDKVGRHKPALKNCLDIDYIFDALIGAVISLSHNKEKHFNIKKKIKEIYVPIVLTYNSYASSIVEPKQIIEFGLHEMGKKGKEPFYISPTFILISQTFVDVSDKRDLEHIHCA